MSTIWMMPFDSTPYGMYKRLISLPPAAELPLKVETAIGPCTPGGTVFVPGILNVEPGFCPGKPKSSMYFGLPGSPRSKILRCWFGLLALFQPSKPGSEGRVAPPTIYAMPVRQSHQLLCVTSRPFTGVEASVGLEGLVTSQTSWD